MGGWKVFKKKLIKKSSDDSNKIINSLGALADNFFEQCRPVRTRAVKLNLVKLGHELGYKVYANGLIPEDMAFINRPFVNREWLFDLHWYTDGIEPYTIKSLPLAVECEWNPKRKGDGKVLYSGVKYDFQKLLVTNAGLRLMIFTVRNVAILEILNPYFRETIDNYEHLAPNAKFLLVAFNNKSRCFYYKKIKKCIKK
jgi:hypothetical protein